MDKEVDNRMNRVQCLQTELSNCNFVKTVLMLLVVFYHSILFWSGNWFTGTPVFSSVFLPLLARWLNSFHIYGFALVSGYIFFFLKYENGKYQKFSSFAVNKIKRLIVPYFFVLVVWVIPFAEYFFSFKAKDLFINYILGVAPNQLWFLLMLFWVFILFYPFSDFFKNKNMSGAIAVVLLYGVGTFGLRVLPNLFRFLSAFTYIPLFWLGFKIRQCKKSDILRKIPSFVWIFAHIACFALIQQLNFPKGIIFTLLETGLNFLLHILGALMSFVVLQQLADRINWQENRIFCTLKKSSFTIYLFHQQIIYVIIHLLNGLLNPYLHAFVNFFGAIVVSLLISALMMKFKVTKILIGEK